MHRPIGQPIGEPLVLSEFRFVQRCPTPGPGPGIDRGPIPRQRVLSSIWIDVLGLPPPAAQSVGYSNMSHPAFTAATAATASGAAAVAPAMINASVTTSPSNASVVRK